MHTANTRLASGLHSKQLYNPLKGKYSDLAARSALGLVRVYNKLPQRTVDAPSVKVFQRFLQEELKEQAAAGVDNWKHHFATH